MMRIPNDFYIKCNKCNHVSLVETDGLDYETSVYDRPMGEEIEYTFHGEICCEKCHSWIEFCIRFLQLAHLQILRHGIQHPSS